MLREMFIFFKPISRTFLLVTALFYVSVVASNEESSESIIRKAFLNQVRFGDIDYKRQLSICFDTCEQIIFPLHLPTAPVWDFALIFEYFLGLGRDNPVNAEIGQYHDRMVLIARRYAPKCVMGQLDEASAKCVLNKMAKHYSIQIADEVSDEGQTCVGFRDPLKMDERAKSFKCTK